MSFAGIIRESLNGIVGAGRSVLLTVLIECNHSDNPNFVLDNRIFPLKRGQWISSNQRISELTGLSRQQVRTGIKVNQQLTTMSTSKATSRATLYVIENPDKFLVKQKDQPAHQPAKAHAANQQLTINNKEQRKNNKEQINNPAGAFDFDLLKYKRICIDLNGSCHVGSADLMFKACYERDNPREGAA